MPAIVVVGAQWGDEGKGKAADQLGQRANMVVKFNGGNNAGHTVKVGGDTFALHLVPTGILAKDCIALIGNGVVVDPEALFSELDALESRGVDTSNLRVAATAHVITSYHRLFDGIVEKALGDKRIGTTGRGIGPTYEAKVARNSVRIQDIFHPDVLRERVEAGVFQKNLVLRGLGLEEISVDEVVAKLSSYADRLRPMVVDGPLLVNQALDAGKTVVFEGGQATMLDIDHGTYPYVTSSNGTAGGACTGAGVGPTRINRVVAVIKAYTTRVGEGPFPTELDGEEGEWLRKAGGEYGVTTGRPRRTGWYDAVVARYAARINGVTDFVMTKLDVLTGLEKIPVCVAYDVNGKRVDEVPADAADFAVAKPIYEYADGWTEDISGARTFADLPKNAQKYVRWLEEISGARFSIIGVGADRDAVIVLHDLVEE